MDKNNRKKLESTQGTHETGVKLAEANELYTSLFERAHGENEDFLQDILNSVRDAIVVINDKANIIYWNPAAEKTFGYISKEVIGRNIHEIVCPKNHFKEAKARIEMGIKTFIETGTGYFTIGSVQVVGSRKDGSQFPAQLSISPIRLRGKWNAVGVVKDATDIKRAEQKLREAEQRYHNLFNQSPLGVLVVEPKTALFVDFNDKAHMQLGYSREEFEKLTVFDIEAKESEGETLSRIDEILRAGYAEFETQHRTRNGDIKDMLVTIHTIELTGKTLLHAIYHDVTQIRQVQNALIESESRYRQLVELAQEGIWALDNDFTTILVNPRMAQILGYLPSEMISKSFFDFLEPSAVENIKKIMEPYRHRSLKGQFECSFPRKNHRHVDISIAVSTITDDQATIIGILAVMSDISKSKQLEKELRASEERFRAISTSAMDAIILIDEQDNVVYWNPAAENMFGYPEHEAGGKKLSDLVVPKASWEKYHRLISKGLSEKFASDKHFEFNALRKDRTTFPVDLSVSPVKLKDRDCLLTIIRDVTERKAMEDALKQERDTLENNSQRLEEIVQERTDELRRTQAELVKSERLAAIGELAGMVGHDLRNPLTGIKNSAYFLKKKGKDISPEQGREMLETIDKCVDYSNKIVNDLLDYSKAIFLDVQLQLPKKLLDECLLMVKIPRKIRLANTIDESLTFEVDSDKIKRVFLNLIKNALDAMPNGGSLTINGKKVNGKLEITFTDTGIGISEEVLPKLFAPLFTTKAQGMGFGLAISKRLVEAHGGSLTVNTVKGKGTAFIVTLPVERKLKVGGEKVWVTMPESSLLTTTKPLEEQ